MSKKICLIDGSGYIFRAFYGLPPLTAPDGTPVNAVFGFTNMFMRLTGKIPCDYCLVLFDAKRRNFRNDIFPDYKATRKEIPEDLIPQFSIIHEAVSALNLNYLDMDGYEADDLIATYTDLALKEGLDVVVVSADKDLMQLIRPHVEFYDPMKDKYFTPEDVHEKFGVYPDKVVDVQALSGDSTDNVPGVAGIGPKTAAELVNTYGSLEGVLAHAAEIKQNKRRETLLANVDNARISLQLVTLKSDVPVTQPISDFHCRAPQKDVLDKFITDYGFFSLRSRAEKWLLERCSNVTDMKAANIVFKPREIVKNYELVQTEAKLKLWCEKIRQARCVALTVMSTGLDPVFNDMVGLSLSVAPGEACYIPFSHQKAADNLDLFAERQSVTQLSADVIARCLRPLLTARSILKIGHNIKLSMHFLRKTLGIDNVFPLDDISVISYDLDSSEHGHSVEDLATLFLDAKPLHFVDLVGSGKTKIPLANVSVDLAKEYMAQRADYIFRLWQLLKPRLLAEKKTAIYENFDRPLIQTLYAMEERGVMVNSQSLRDLSTYFAQKIQQIEQEIFALAGEEFNIGSPKQIGDILFAKQGHKGKKTPTGAWQTGADVLEELADNDVTLAAKILEWREFSKLKSTYTDSLFALMDNQSRIHTTYTQIVANTGRLASNNPNLQNIPIRREEGKKIRSCFIARKGYKLISSDYSQVELRLLASYADVKNLQKAFAAGLDIHAATASHVFGVSLDEVSADLRRQAKAINFGIVYGISAYGLAKNIGSTPEAAKAYIDAYFAQMPEIKTYMDKTIEFAHKHGYVETPFGRKCPIMGINDKNKRLVANAERAAINAPIQGGAADIIKLAMNSIEQKLQQLGLQTKMLLQVHDELVFEAPESEVADVQKLIKETMENVVSLKVPFIAEVGIGDNWTQAH